MRIAGAPEQRAARLAEAVERADEGEVAERLFLQPDALGEVIEAAERPAFALADDRVGLTFAEAVDTRQAEPNVMGTTRPMLRDGDGSVDDFVIGSKSCGWGLAN